MFVLVLSVSMSVSHVCLSSVCQYVCQPCLSLFSLSVCLLGLLSLFCLSVCLLGLLSLFCLVVTEIFKHLPDQGLTRTNHTKNEK